MLLKGLILVTLFVIVSSLMISQVYAQEIITKDKPKGIVYKLDDRIFIVQHTAEIFTEIKYLFGESYTSTETVIYGDIVNLSDESVYYIIMRGNVYKDGNLFPQTGPEQLYTFRYKYEVQKGNPNELAASPFKKSLKPGEAAPFALFPDQLGWDCYEVWVESYRLEEKYKDITDDRLRNDFVFSDGKRSESGYFTSFVHNPTEKSIRNVYAISIEYNDQNEIIWMGAEDLGSIGSGKSEKFSRHTEDVHTVELIATGHTEFNDGSGTFLEKADSFHPVKYMSESQYFPDKPRPKYMNLDELKEKAKLQQRDPIQTDFCSSKQKHTSEIPIWVKNNAKQLSNGMNKPELIFLTNIEYLIENEVIHVPKTLYFDERVLPFMPNWAKKIAVWWAEDRVTDDDFLYGIKYLIEQGIIRL